MSSTIYILICAILSVGVLIGLSLMSKVKTAVAGNLISAISVLIGIVITLLYREIFSAWSIYVFILIGSFIGAIMSVRVKMIQMPQLVALLNGLGGVASALIGILSLLGIGVIIGDYPIFVNVTSMLAIIVGLVTFTGSLVAAGKLHKLLPQKPVNWKSHSTILIVCMLILIAVTILSAFLDKNSVAIAPTLFIAILVSSFFGIALSIRVGGADMPITISLLNSLTGVAGAVVGMAVNDVLLVSVGGIVGASGLILTQIMCKAMNRHLGDILTGKTSTPKEKKVENEQQAEPVTYLPGAEASYVDTDLKEEVITSEIHEEIVSVEKNEGEILKSAKRVIIVPGYGMALAQAQHLVRELADKLAANGAEVKYAIHPVAGRMPGHMNVLLAEADVSYEQLFEMDAVNDLFVETDVVIVIGANDVINPAARDAKDTPIYGMPVLNVDQAKEVFICNFDLNPGYAGVDNPLYKRGHGMHLKLGDAKDSLQELINTLD